MNQLKVLNSLIKAGKPSQKLFNNLLLNSDENASKIILKSMAFLGLKADRVDDVNDLIAMAKSERIVWERFSYLYEIGKVPDEKTICALMDYYVDDLEMVKKIYKQMSFGVTRNLKSVLDGNTPVRNDDTNPVKIQRTVLSKNSLLNSLIAARDLKGAYDLLDDFPKDSSFFSRLQEFNSKDSLDYIQQVSNLFKHAKIHGHIDQYQALEPDIQYAVAKQDFEESSILIQKYLEGGDDKVKSPRMQPIILNYYLKRNNYQKAFELFLDCNPKIQLECIPYLMATLTKLDDNCGFTEQEVFEMVGFVWNVYVFLLRSGNAIKEYYRLQRTLQHALRYFVKAENENYSDKVFIHALNSSVNLDIHLLCKYGELKLKNNGNVWTRTLIPTLAYPPACRKFDPFTNSNNTQTLENSGLLPEDLYQDESIFFEFPYTIKPEIEADLIEVLLLLYGKSVNVDYANCQTKLSTEHSLKSFYYAIRPKANRSVYRLLTRLSILKNYDDLVSLFVQGMKQRDREIHVTPFYENLLGPTGSNLLLDTRDLFDETVNLQIIYQEYRNDTERKFCKIDRVWTENNLTFLSVRQMVKNFVETKRQEVLEANSITIPAVPRVNLLSRPQSKQETIAILETEKDFLIKKIAFLQSGIEIEDSVMESLQKYGMGEIMDLAKFKERLEIFDKSSNLGQIDVGFGSRYLPRTLTPISCSNLSCTVGDAITPEMKKLLEEFESLESPLSLPKFELFQHKQSPPLDIKLNPTPPPSDQPKIKARRRKLVYTTK